MSELSLGPDVVGRLLPHRRPFLMVDRIRAFTRDPRPALEASRLVSANEAVFEGHFPGLHLWPGVYTIEGLGQSCYLLNLLVLLQDGWAARGEDPGDVVRGLLALERRFRLQPGGLGEAGDKVLEVLDAAMPDMRTRMGMSAAVDVKLLRPVFAGERIDFRVTQTHELGDLLRFEVWAEVDGRGVAKGVMTSARSPVRP